MDATAPALPVLPRLPTGVPGLDAVLGGGLLAGDAYLVAGDPGTGKTTLGNQLAFAHAAAGGSALVGTLVTESHDRMLAHLGGLAFADPALVGERLRHLSLLGPLRDGGLDGLLAALAAAVREHGAGLVVLDGAGAAGAPDAAGFDHGRFVHGLRARLALLGCTAVLLAGGAEAAGAAAHADGLVLLSAEVVEGREVRWLRVAKLRGAAPLGGRHRFAIRGGGVEVFPRLEAAFAGLEPAFADAAERVPLGVPGLDAMLAGGLPAGSATLVLGTPGAGKTLIGLHFLAEGARRGEPGLVAAFHETAPALAATADRAGMGLGPHLAAGLVRVLWRPPLELAPDEWAWRLLAEVDARRPRRLVVDAFTDLAPLLADPARQTRFAAALANALRDRGVTSLVVIENDAFVGPELAVPVPSVSATMDNAILLRAFELRSALLRRLVSVLKERESAFDPAIREFAIGPEGIAVGEPVAAANLLTGAAVPLPGSG